MSARTVSGVLTIAAVVSSLVGLGLCSVVTTGALPQTTVRTGASAYLPADGDVRSVHTIAARPGTAHGTLEQVVAASLTEAVGSLPYALNAVMAADPPPEMGPWWRENLLSTASWPQYQRVHVVTDHGIELRAVLTGSYQQFVFNPGIVVLPGDLPSSSTSWRATGTARLNLGNNAPRDLPYRMAGTISPSAPDGCRTVDIDLTVTVDASSYGESEVRLGDRSTWCPGRGVVVRQPASKAMSIGFEPSPAGWTDVVNLHLSQPPAPFLFGQAVAYGVRFGLGPGVEAAQLDGMALPVSDGDGGLVNPVDPAVLAGIGAGGFDPEANVVRLTAWWDSRPGGRILSLTNLGTAVLATTSRSTVVAYAVGGVRAWVAPLPDLAVAAPVPYGPDGVAVLSLDGSVTGYALGGGTQRWQVRVPGARFIAGAAGRIAVANMLGQVTLLDPTGRIAATASGPAGPTGMDFTGGRPVLWGDDWVAAVGVDGEPGWRYPAPGLVEVATTADGGYGWTSDTVGRVLIRTAGGVDALRADTGVREWFLPGAVQALTGLTAGFAVVRDGTIGLYSSDGLSRSSLPLPGGAPGPDDQIVVRAEQERLWVISRTPQGMVRAVRLELSRTA